MIDDNGRPLVMCGDCSTTRSVAPGLAFTHRGRYLRCKTCGRPTRHKAMDGAHDDAEAINAAPDRRQGIAAELSALNRCAQLGIRVDYVPQIEAPRPKIASQLKFGFYLIDGRAHVVVRQDLTPEGRAAAIRLALWRALDPDPSRDPELGYAFSAPELDRYRLPDVSALFPEGGASA